MESSGLLHFSGLPDSTLLLIYPDRSFAGLFRIDDEGYIDISPDGLYTEYDTDDEQNSSGKCFFQHGPYELRALGDDQYYGAEDRAVAAFVLSGDTLLVSHDDGDGTTEWPLVTDTSTADFSICPD